MFILFVKLHLWIKFICYVENVFNLQTLPSVVVSWKACVACTRMYELKVARGMRTESSSIQQATTSNTRWPTGIIIQKNSCVFKFGSIIQKIVSWPVLVWLIFCSVQIILIRPAQCFFLDIKEPECRSSAFRLRTNTVTQCYLSRKKVTERRSSWKKHWACRLQWQKLTRPEFL